MTEQIVSLMGREQGDDCSVQVLFNADLVFCRHPLQDRRMAPPRWRGSQCASPAYDVMRQSQLVYYAHRAGVGVTRSWNLQQPVFSSKNKAYGRDLRRIQGPYEWTRLRRKMPPFFMTFIYSRPRTSRLLLSSCPSIQTQPREASRVSAHTAPSSTHPFSCRSHAVLTAVGSVLLSFCRTLLSTIRKIRTSHLLSTTIVTP